MPRNKPRLQLALYARPKHPGTFHYALFISPKLDNHHDTRKLSSDGGLPPAVPVTKFHVKNTLNATGASPWRFERVDLADMASDPRLLVVVTIGKFVAGDVRRSPEGIERFLSERVPVLQGVGKEEFNCLSWVRDAVQALREDGLVREAGAWDEQRARAVFFTERKVLEGRWDVGWNGAKGVPTLDLFTGAQSVT